MELLKATRLMKITTDVGPCYKNLVKDIIVNITIECNVEGGEQYRRECDKGKCMKL